MMPERNSTASRSSYRKEDDNYQHANGWVNNNLSGHWEPEVKQNDANHFILLQDIDLEWDLIVIDLNHWNRQFIGAWLSLYFRI